MSGDYVVSMSVGPVQEFISAARRTRDLWFGSHVLSEVSKAAALAVHEQGGDLIFPAPESPVAELAPDSSLLVANKIVAIVREGGQEAAQRLADAAEAAARDRWKQFADEALSLGADAIRREIWDAQVDDVVEFYAAWVPVRGSYGEARARAEVLLAGRKAVRDFIPARGRAGVPKSSLDGARESVLVEDPAVKMGKKASARARLKRNEHLDCVGWTKRVAGDPERFPSVMRVAADPWVRGLAATEVGGRYLAELKEACAAGASGRLDHPAFRGFPFEGEVLFPTRLSALLEEDESDRIKEALTRVAEIRSKWGREVGEPIPYLSVLAADGDKMGMVISKQRDPEAHRALSRCLADFAREARDLVVDHYGALVYSGGDDVLALLPVDTCLGAAHALHQAFSEAFDQTLVDADRPTLSVGVSIAHCQEMLEDLVLFGRDALRVAKAESREGAGDARDGLAVSYTSRGGAPTTVRLPWTEKPVERLEQWAELQAGGAIPHGLAYEVRRLVDTYLHMERSEAWPHVPAEVLKRDLARVIGRKRAAGGSNLEAGTGAILANVGDSVRSPLDLRALGDELVVARVLGDGMRQAKPAGFEKGGVEG